MSGEWDAAFERAAAALEAALEAENAALRALDIRRAVALFPRKADCAARLRDVLARSRPGVVPDDAARARVASLATLAEENRRLLERAMAIQGKLIATLARAMPRGGVGYGCPARPARGGAVRPLTLSARA